ncbi:hypothetical protein [Mesorhizobium sp. B4-1-1]|uniref:hypothetical protein n=1 Tax=Mesorhizobium sp. B4-1-1 TaxID=2589890 RepID=UPI00112B4F92|nr:hypothetical protein [Mesorhizobium sp. B4-1-1]TPI16582.1 hypothetical protein FJW10_22720 [Mesorhizobium sp. B4-1-1]
MNTHVSRRSIFGASASLAAMAMPPVAAAQTAPTVDVAMAVSPELLRLKAAYDDENRKWKPFGDRLAEAETRYFDSKPPKPEWLSPPRLTNEEIVKMLEARLKGGDNADYPRKAEIEATTRENKAREEAWRQACDRAQRTSGLDKALRAEKRLSGRRHRAGEKVMCFPARSLQDMELKLRVQREFFYNDFQHVLAKDIRRLAKAQRALQVAQACCKQG